MYAIYNGIPEIALYSYCTVIVIGDGQQMSTQVYSYAFHDQTRIPFD